MTTAIPAPTLVTRPWPFEVCAHCDGEEFAVTSHTPGGVVFTCVACHTRWRYLLGYLIPIDPTSTSYGARDTALVGATHHRGDQQ